MLTVADNARITRGSRSVTLLRLDRRLHSSSTAWTSLVACAISGCSLIVQPDTSGLVPLTNPTQDPDSGRPVDASVYPPELDAGPPQPCRGRSDRCENSIYYRCIDRIEIPVLCHAGCAPEGDRCLRVAPSNISRDDWDVAAEQAGPLRIDGYASVDTTSCAFQDAKTRVYVGGMGLCALFVSELLIGEGATLRVDGQYPLAIFSTGPITIAGMLDASAMGAKPGPGGGAGGAGSMLEGRGPSGGTGVTFGPGGGGGYCGGGGASAGPGGGSVSIGALVPLRGGSGGGAPGGGGGGAVQLTSDSPIRILGGGSIQVAGGGGAASGFSSNAGGGGSGGALLLESPSIEVAGRLIATGGSGGGVGIAGRDGKDELNPVAGPAPAAPGIGASGGGTEVNGQMGTVAFGGAGGGGGAGAIVVRSLGMESVQYDITRISPRVQTCLFATSITLE